jgi:hypothetical protein
MKTILTLAVFAFVLPLMGQTKPAEPKRPRLQIINGSAAPVEIFWLKSDTERVPRGTIAPGKDQIVITSLGHKFAVVGKGGVERIATAQVRVQGFRFDEASAEGVPAFYTQTVKAHGFPIVASAKVDPYALKEAAFILDQMLANRSDVREAMIQSGARLCIMAHNEYTTDLPEFKRMEQNAPKQFPNMPPKDYWDARARGLGGSETDPLCTCAEENVLGFRGDPYEKECILIHEFAHCIHLRGMVNVDATFDARLKAAYDAAIKAGLWKGKYASVNHHEYWAEGVQSWFDDNRENDHDHTHVNNRVNDHDHNHVHLRSQLIEYDPGLAALCREVFGDTAIKYTKPATRLTGHMTGYNPAKAPVFAWPERLAKARALIKAAAQERERHANSREPREISGWTVNVSKELLEKEAAATNKALELMKAMLDEIVRVVPVEAVAQLQQVPLYVSPQYPNSRPRAEYHPDEGWLRDNGRDPAMAKGVEFSNVQVFESEMRRMPNFALHELAHAYHDRVLGFEEDRIKACFEKARASGKYEKVQRQNSEGVRRFDRAYAMTNQKEYFAECSEAFFSRNDFFPFNKEELKQHDPEMFEVLGIVWKVSAP